ncbi:MAG: hypothetical protein KAY65_13030 [Planctomycetes bacterium]|nr:hypothetical protein [Planctomycetota bacterium]
MDKKIIAVIVLTFLVTVGACSATENAKTCGPDKNLQAPQPRQVKADPVDAVLKQLNNKTLQLKSYQAQLEYKFTQPLLESEALRKGILYYAKFGKKSKLRINFQTLKQDDEKEQKYIEHYIVLDGNLLTGADYKLEGFWLVHINHQIEEIKYYQLTKPHEPNKPADVFELASKKLPLIGFTKIENLKKQFEITLIEQKKDKPTSFIQLHLKVKPNSTYKDDYVCLDFWIDKKLCLPTKVVAVSTEEDVYEIKFLKPKVNKKIDKRVFELKIPKGFGEPEIIPLKKKNT